MLAQELFNLRSAMQQNGVIFAYSGFFTESILGGVGEALKQKLTVEDADTKTMRSVFAIFVEQMQNIIRYSAEKVSATACAEQSSRLSELRYGVLTVGQVRDHYIVHAGNLISRTDTERLRKRLQEISAMDKAQLKAAYKAQLRAGPDEYSKGAGIGFIEIARRASKPIEFDFMEVDDDYAFFVLKADI